MSLYSTFFQFRLPKDIFYSWPRTLRVLIAIILSCNVLMIDCNWAKAGQDKQPLLFAIHQPEHTQIYKWMNLVYNDLFSRLDRSVTLIYLPPKRATAYARSGKIDGQVGRMASYAKKVENQIKVNVPIYYLDMVAYVRSTSNLKRFEGWASVKNKGLKIDYLRGIAIAEKNLTPLIPSANLQVVDTMTQGFLRVKEGRADVFVASNHSAEPLLLSLPYKDDISNEGILDSVGLYPHVHIRHRNIVPLIEAAIKEMRKEGLINMYKQHTLQ